MRRSYWLPMLCLILGGLIFATAQNRISRVKRNQVNAEISVTLPLFIQVVLAGGDRYLAASWAAIRALVTETARMSRDEYRVLAEVQQDASWLNPAHEDNYYIAAAILPWEGQLDPAQVTLRRATLARFYDYQPPFYYAFNLLHFKADGLAAAEWLRHAAPKLPNPDERLIMENYAARWLDRTDDLDLAARIVDAMAAQTKRKDFADYLHMRSQRLRDLALLRRTAIDYANRHGAPPGDLADLVQSGLLQKLPSDPLGFGFGLDPKGVPILFNGPRQ